MSADDHDRTLILLRHAKAEKGRAKDDIDRELADRGFRDAEAAGEWLVAVTSAGRLGPVDLTVCSTAVRARQTWDAVVTGGCAASDVWYDPALYNARPEALLDVVRELPEEVRTAMVVGHVPGVPSFAELLLTDEDGESAGIDVLTEGWPTCGLAVLRCTSTWATLQPHSARLQEFVAPRG